MDTLIIILPGYNLTPGDVSILTDSDESVRIIIPVTKSISESQQKIIDSFAGWRDGNVEILQCDECFFSEEIKRDFTVLGLAPFSSSIFEDSSKISLSEKWEIINSLLENSFIKNLPSPNQIKRIIITLTEHPIIDAIYHNYKGIRFDLYLDQTLPSGYNPLLFSDCIYGASNIYSNPIDQEILLKIYGPGIGFKLSDPGKKEVQSSNNNDKKKAHIKKRCKIVQLVHSIVPGDAISSQAFFIHRLLNEHGYKAVTAGEHVDPSMREWAYIADSNILNEADGIIYHHSIGTALTTMLRQSSLPSLLVYHNVTPPEFFTRYNPLFAETLKLAREELFELSRFFEHAMGDSLFNCDELREAGFSDPIHLPLPVDPRHWPFPPDVGTYRKLNDGFKNILFVGRIVPNKNQHQIIGVFNEMLKKNHLLRLCLPGEAVEPSYLHSEILPRLKNENLRERVLLPGKVNDSSLMAYFLKADLYLSLSDHEGFGVPLLESMWFDIPVAARRGSAVDETMEDSGFLFDSKTDIGEMADICLELISNSELRRKTIEKQRIRREKFSGAYLTEKYINVLNSIFTRRISTDHDHNDFHR